MHPDDADELWACTTASRSRSPAAAAGHDVPALDADIPPGVVFMPIHWNELWADGRVAERGDQRRRPTRSAGSRR